MQWNEPPEEDYKKKLLRKEDKMIDIDQAAACVAMIFVR